MWMSCWVGTEVVVLFLGRNDQLSPPSLDNDRFAVLVRVHAVLTYTHGGAHALSGYGARGDHLFEFRGQGVQGAVEDPGRRDGEEAKESGRGGGCGQCDFVFVL